MAGWQFWTLSVCKAPAVYRGASVFDEKSQDRLCWQDPTTHWNLSTLSCLFSPFTIQPPWRLSVSLFYVKFFGISTSIALSPPYSPLTGLSPKQVCWRILFLSLSTFSPAFFPPPSALWNLICNKFIHGGWWLTDALCAPDLPLAEQLWPLTFPHPNMEDSSITSLADSGHSCSPGPSWSFPYLSHVFATSLSLALTCAILAQ